MPTIALILLVTLCTIGSQLLLKRAMVPLTPVLEVRGAVDFLIAAAWSPWVWAALVIQVGGYVMWMFVLTRSQLSVAFAVSGSFFYLLMAAASWLVFNERLTALQWGGLLMISAGVMLVTLGASK